MFKLIKESFKRTNNSIVLAIPLVIFVLLAQIYYTFAKENISSVSQIIFSAATIIVLTSGFMASWFYMVKKVLAYSNKIFVFEKDRSNAISEVFMAILFGIGRLFLPFLGFLTLNFAIYYILHLCTSFIVIKYFGSINYELLNVNMLLNPVQLHSEIMNLSTNTNLPLCIWIGLIIIGASVVSFISMFWIPEIVYSKKNVLMSLYNSVQKLIITFFKSLAVFIYIELIIVICTLISIVCMDNIYLYFLAILSYYYLFIYIVVLLYTYYEQTFLE